MPTRDPLPGPETIDREDTVMTLDRTGEPIDDTDAGLRLVVSHDRRCRRGWLGEDPEGRPIPCLTCRPHLRRQES